MPNLYLGFYTSRFSLGFMKKRPTSPKAKKASKSTTSSKKTSLAKTEENRTAAIVLSYLGILSLVVYFGFKRDAETTFHMRQGLALCAVELALWFGQMLFGWTFMRIFHTLQILVFVVGLWAMAQGLKGEKWEIPYLKPIVDKMPQ